MIYAKKRKSTKGEGGGGLTHSLPFFLLISSSGSSELAIKVPDTITKWKASALCLSGTTGLGLSPIISLQVFQPFFLELTLPYSVVRGEAFTLKATVFNYLSHCIRVRALLYRWAKGEGRDTITIHYLGVLGILVNHNCLWCNLILEWNGY